jgi:isocitrate/isopropylmalate dehydrogenase
MILMKKDAVSAADGIGSEVTCEAIMVFDAAQNIFGFELPYSEVDGRG